MTPDEFADRFITGIRKVSDTNASWLAMHGFRLLDDTIIDRWAEGSAKRLGDTPLDAETLKEACLGPLGQPAFKDWLFQTAWGKFAIRYYRGSSADKAAMIGMLLLNFQPEDWSELAEFMSNGN